MTLRTSTVPDLWSFMLKLYAMPGAAQACLELQDRFELDVPLFLALLHGAGRGYRIDSETIRALDNACGKWRAEVVRPLRAVRVQLKANPWKENHEPVVAFRERIKALELEAEKLEVSVLEKAIIALARTENHVDKPARIAAVAHMVLSHFAADNNLTGELPQASLIVDAVRSLLRRQHRT